VNPATKTGLREGRNETIGQKATEGQGGSALGKDGEMKFCGANEALSHDPERGKCDKKSKKKKIKGDFALRNGTSRTGNFPITTSVKAGG